MDNLRILQEHKRFGLRNGTLIERDKVEHAMRKISVDNSVLHYSLLLHDREYGHGALHWCVQGKRVKQELIEITPRGFGLWNNHFDNLETLFLGCSCNVSSELKPLIDSCCYHLEKQRARVCLRNLLWIQNIRKEKSNLDAKSGVKTV